MNDVRGRSRISLARMALLAACAASTAVAQDRATLDLLVKKGVVTPAEADALMAEKPKSPVVMARNPDAVHLTVGGLVQARAIQLHATGPGAKSAADVFGFQLRRAILSFEADFGGGLSAVIAPEFDASRTGAHQLYLDSVYLKYTTTAGAATAGFRKVNFGAEETSSSATELLVVEKSAATRALATNAFAAYHLGLFWDGKLKDTGWAYGAAVTNSQQDLWSPGGSTTPVTSNNNAPAAWANVRYDTAPAEAHAATALGLNLGYVDDMGGGYAGVFGYNPFVKLRAGAFTAVAELIGWRADGRGATGDAHPLGENLTFAYRVDPAWEPVVRLSHLDMGGARVAAATAIHTAPVIAGTFDEAWSAYAGVNWYIRKNTLKVQGGYEFTHLGDASTGAAPVDVHAVRIQLQAMF